MSRTMLLCLLSALSISGWALSPASWHARPIEPEERSALDAATCRSHGTALERVEGGSGFALPSMQAQDKRAIVTCSPHDFQGDLTTKRIFACAWHDEKLSCDGSWTRVDFAIDGVAYQVTFLNERFQSADAVQILRDVVEDLSTRRSEAGETSPTSLEGPCALNRDSDARPREKGGIEMHCKNVAMAIERTCAKEKCRYAIKFLY